MMHFCDRYFINWSALFSGIAALSAMITAFIALYGVKEWKKQLKGKTDYEIARGYLKATLQLRDAIKYVRRPLIPLEEMQSSLKENGLNPDDLSNNKKINRAVYATRWKKVIDAISNFEAELLEAEVSWGDDAVNIQKSLSGLVRKLYATIYMYLREDLKINQDELKLIYDTGDIDNFSKQINDAVGEIKEFLKPHLL